jgi:hypothetical protein
MRRVAAVVLVALGGCTSVKMVQRDNCWVKRTEKAFGQVREEVGPCTHPNPPWVEDRLTRLVQECVAREDYRWQARALAAWNRGEPLPPQAEGGMLQACMNEASRAMIAENESLKQRLAEVSGDRDALKSRHEAEVAGLTARFEADRERLQTASDKLSDHLLTTSDKLADYLGEAASKAQAPATATATATSEGTQHTENASTTPAASPVVVAATSAPACAPGEKPEPVDVKAQPLKRARVERKARVAPKPPECSPRADAPDAARLEVKPATAAAPEAAGAADAAGPAPVR